MSDPPADPPQPSARDLENAAVRAAIAAKAAAEYTEAMKLALGVLGPGWTPWMKLSLIDSDHHRTGNTEPVAVAFKVYRGPEKLSENSAYLRRMPDGQVMRADSYEPLFGDLLREPHPTRGFEHNGQWCPYPRWALCWSALELYSPKSPEELAKLRLSREQRKAKREEKAWAEANPLLVWAEQVGREEAEGRGR